MYSRQLDVFIMVAERGSVSAAARALYVTPAAVSQQLGMLEERLGVRLFERSKRGMALTRAGSYLYKRSLEMVESTRRWVEDARAMQLGDEMGLVVATDHVIHVFMSDAVAAYLAKNPGSNVRYEPSGQGGPLEEVRAGRADLCVYGVGDGLRSSGLSWEPIFDDRVYLLVSSRSRLAAMGSVGPEDLVGLEVFMPLPGYSDASDGIYRLAGEAGFHATSRVGMDEGFLLQALASDPAKAAMRLGHHARSFPGLACVPYRNALVPSVALAFREPPSPAVVSFVECAKSAMADYRACEHQHDEPGV